MSGTPGRIGYQVWFAGCTAADVDTLIFRRYVSDGSFSTLIDSATTFFPEARQSGDTVFSTAGNSRFLSCDNTADYEIVVPALSKTFRIWDINYGADTAAIEYEATDCKDRSFGPARAYGAQVSGEHTLVSWQFGQDIYLRP